ncbi:MAG: xanthine dehydrogenase small subunit [Burkholderiales bacterium]|nr:xanthine dehydrogenase small subunit [Burkholderiales bacterium]
MARAAHTRGARGGSRAVRFVLDGEVHAVRDVAPTRTVLEYLREDLGRTGTKEGCAEGDCGACTVVVSEFADGRVRLRAMNACIQFLPTLDGKALFTVESLRNRATGALHPVQQALADGHGSQCGFCTPGFVMSLFALYKTDPAPDRAAVNDALAGNLCRCTGYRPIVDAAQTMYALGRALPPGAQGWMEAPAGVDTRAAGAGERALARSLGRLVRRKSLALPHPAGTFYAPRSCAELAELRARLPDARLLAGGTDVGLWVTKQHRELGDLIYVGNVAELRTVDAADEIAIGAAVPLADAAAAIVRRYPELGELLRRFASPPIRNAGTLAGNVANGSPIGDSMPALIALGARVALRRGKACRELALEDFYLGYQRTALAPGELVERVIVPARPAGLRFAAYKLSKRFDQDISAVCAAFALVLEGGRIAAARIAFGGMAATPRRAAACEAALAGATWSGETCERAAAALAHDYQPITDMRASAHYRLRVAQNLLRRFHLETTGALGREPGQAPARLDDLREALA